MARLDIFLRTHQLAYLRQIAQWDDVSVSRALGSLIEAAAPTGDRRAPSKKHRANVFLQADHLAMLERMAAEAGQNRSEIARRLIEEAAKAHAEMVTGV